MQGTGGSFYRLDNGTTFATHLWQARCVKGLGDASSLLGSSVGLLSVSIQLRGKRQGYPETKQNCKGGDSVFSSAFPQQMKDWGLSPDRLRGGPGLPRGKVPQGFHQGSTRVPRGFHQVL